MAQSKATGISAEAAPAGVGPKYLQVKAFLKDSIRDRRYGIGDRLPSENELARLFGMSRHTVLKGMAELSAEGWIDRQQGRGTFVSNRFLGRAAGRMVVALICSDQEEVLMTQVMRGISASLSSRRRELLVLNSDHSIEREAELIDGLEDRGIGGAILWPVRPPANAERVERLVRHGVPVVLIDRGIDGLDVPVVCTDHERGAYEVTHHLIELGHRRIAHITFRLAEGQWVGPIVAREQGHRRAMEEAGLEVPQEFVQRVDPEVMEWAHEPPVQTMLAYEHAHRLLTRKDRPTAIFLLNDLFAASVYRAVVNHGFAVPGDVAIAGFNNDPEAWNLPVPLTTYAQPADRIGRTAGDMIQQLMNRQPVKQMRVELRGKLIVRQSTALVNAQGDGGRQQP